VRLFIAAYPPAEAVADLTAQVGRLHIGAAAARGVNVRLTAAETLHVTLAFLGDVDDSRLPDVTRALGRAEQAWHRRPGGPGSPDEVRPPRVRLAGGGRFGRRQFTLLWIGLAGDVAALRTLNLAIRRELRRARLPYDERPFRPHVTLARPGDRVTAAEVDEDRRVLDGYLGPSWPVAEMLLMRSHLGPKPTYDRLAAWPL
jgi:RNA 2',3'-cyclic 3'-phosphodiesterase